jgi:hypothetical protein
VEHAPPLRAWLEEQSPPVNGGFVRRLRITILDLAAKGPTTALYARVMNANLASIMPQVLAVWCEELGHEVRYVCYTGFEDLDRELQVETDVLFVGAFTETALLATAVSKLFRDKGAVTVLGGPHARCYPEDAARWFDYVVGWTDKAIVEEILAEATPHRPLGRWLEAPRQPRELPGVPERWKFIEATLRKAPTIKVVPMIASFGCPYTCSFCIDAEVAYQPMAFAGVQRDLKFLLTKMKKPMVAWHDPNFGVRFDECLSAIEEVVPPGRIDFIAESSLSILNEERLKRLKKNGFGGLLPGVESWFSMGNKSKTGKAQGRDKVLAVADQVNTILRYVPYVQTNFVLGLDMEEGSEPFELTKEFMDLCPGAFPGFSLMTAFGRAAPLNKELQREGRVLPFPFHFLNNNQAMNVIPRNYTWPDFYDKVVDLTADAFSWKRIGARLAANEGMIPKWMNVVRAVSSEGFGRKKYHGEVRRRLDTDPGLNAYLHGKSTVLPEFYTAQIRKDLGRFWDALPEGALEHDPLAYLKSTKNEVRVARAGRVKDDASAEPVREPVGAGATTA